VESFFSGNLLSFPPCIAHQKDLVHKKMRCLPVHGSKTGPEFREPGEEKFATATVHSGKQARILRHLGTAMLLAPRVSMTWRVKLV